jgi:hypothetical protein
MLVELAFRRIPGCVTEDAACGQKTFQVLNARDKPADAEVTIVNEIYSMIVEFMMQADTPVPGT